jgi:hypothetical protein
MPPGPGGPNGQGGFGGGPNGGQPIGSQMLRSGQKRFFFDFGEARFLTACS